MNLTDYPIKIHCPVIDSEETVFFHPQQTGETWTVQKSSFNGCDHNYSDCKECASCKDAAFELLKKQLSK